MKYNKFKVSLAVAIALSLTLSPTGRAQTTAAVCGNGKREGSE